MVSLDSSIIPAIVIFLLVIVALNYLLFQPLMRIQAERAKRTTGAMTESRHLLERHTKLMDSYQTAIKNIKLEGYRRQEQVRDEAIKRRADALERARASAEQMLKESHGQITAQVQAAKQQLIREAQDMASDIASAVLRRLA